MAEIICFGPTTEKKTILFFSFVLLWLVMCNNSSVHVHKFGFSLESHVTCLLSTKQELATLYTLHTLNHMPSICCLITIPSMAFIVGNI